MAQKATPQHWPEGIDVAKEPTLRAVVEELFMELRDAYFALMAEGSWSQTDTDPSAAPFGTGESGLGMANRGSGDLQMPESLPLKNLCAAVDRLLAEPLSHPDEKPIRAALLAARTRMQETLRQAHPELFRKKVTVKLGDTIDVVLKIKVHQTGDGKKVEVVSCTLPEGVDAELLSEDSGRYGSSLRQKGLRHGERFPIAGLLPLELNDKEQGLFRNHGNVTFTLPVIAHDIQKGDGDRWFLDVTLDMPEARRALDKKNP